MPLRPSSTGVAAATTTETTPNPSSSSSNAKKKVTVVDINPRWKGYCFMLLTSLINLSSVANVNSIDNDAKGFSLSFGIVLFVFSLSILLLEWITAAGWYTKTSYAKAYDGKFEGIALVLTTLYSIVGVAYMTRVGGIAYHALNVYFSAWLMLVSHAYTLNAWSASRDILTVQELTGLSSTLKSWYILAIASIVVAGTSIDMMITLSTTTSNNNDNNNTDLWNDEASRAASLGIAFGVCSFVAAFTWICIQYEIIQICGAGGWAELGTIAVVVAIWIVGTGVLTRDGSIGATINGSSSFITNQQQPQPPQPPADSKLSTFPPTSTPSPSTTTTLPEPLIQALWELQQAILLEEPNNNDQNTVISILPPVTDDNTTSPTCEWKIQNETIFNCTAFLELLLDTPIIVETTSPSFVVSPSASPTLPTTTAVPSNGDDDDDVEPPGTQDQNPPPAAEIPGSNLYIAVWTCLISSLNLVARWKAQQALQFAQARQANLRAAAVVPKDIPEDEEIDGEEEDEEDDELEDYEDSEDDF